MRRNAYLMQPPPPLIYKHSLLSICVCVCSTSTYVVFFVCTHWTPAYFPIVYDARTMYAHSQTPENQFQWARVRASATWTIAPRTLHQHTHTHTNTDKIMVRTHTHTHTHSTGSGGRLSGSVCEREKDPNDAEILYSPFMLLLYVLQTTTEATVAA